MQAIADDVISKYVLSHVNIFYCLRGILVNGLSQMEREKPFSKF
jgi:hypothetical protein